MFRASRRTPGSKLSTVRPSARGKKAYSKKHFTPRPLRRPAFAIFPVESQAGGRQGLRSQKTKTAELVCFGVPVRGLDERGIVRDSRCGFGDVDRPLATAIFMRMLENRWIRKGPRPPTGALAAGRGQAGNQPGKHEATWAWC